MPFSRGRLSQMPRSSLISQPSNRCEESLLCSRISITGAVAPQSSRLLFVSGVKSSEAAPIPDGNVSLDQFLARHVAGQTRFPVLNTSARRRQPFPLARLRPMQARQQTTRRLARSGEHPHARGHWRGHLSGHPWCLALGEHLWGFTLASSSERACGQATSTVQRRCGSV